MAGGRANTEVTIRGRKEGENSLPFLVFSCVFIYFLVPLLSYTLYFFYFLENIFVLILIFFISY